MATENVVNNRKYYGYQNQPYVHKKVAGNQCSKELNCIKNAGIIRACPRVLQDIKRDRGTFF